MNENKTVSEETSLKTPNEKAAYNAIFPLLTGLSFGEIKNVIESLWEDVEKFSIFRPGATVDPEQKDPIATESKEQKVDEAIKRLQATLKEMGINISVQQIKCHEDALLNAFFANIFKQRNSPFPPGAFMPGKE